LVQWVVSLFNNCNYCASMQSKFSQVNSLRHGDVMAIRRGEYPGDKNIGYLVWLTRTILEKRGYLTKKEL